MAACRDERPYDHPDAHEVLPLDMLKDAAELRAAGHDWTEVAAALGRNPVHLRLACRRDPRFAAELEEARREVLREIEAEALRKMRAHMLGEDDELSGAHAAERLAKYLADRRKCEARVQAEEVKKEAKLGAERIRADAKAAKLEVDEREPDHLRVSERPRECDRRRAAEQPVRGGPAPAEPPGRDPAECPREPESHGAERPVTPRDREGAGPAG
jgi:hypothetical protein